MNKILMSILIILTASFGQELEKNRINSKDQVILPLITNLSSKTCERLAQSDYTCMPIEIAEFLSNIQKTTMQVCGNAESRNGAKFEFIPFERLNKGSCSPLIFYVKKRSNGNILFFQGVMMELKTIGDSLTIMEMPGHADYFSDK